MTNRSSITDAGENQLRPQRSGLLGWLFFPVSLFPFIALLTHDWRSIEALHVPAAPSSNWVGALGDGFAHWGYQLFGLAVWVVPVICLAWGIRIVLGLKIGFGRRSSWFLLFLCCAASLMQVAQKHAPGIAALLDEINLPNAGGAIGYLLMTRLLTPLLSDFGSAVLVIILSVVSLVCAIGLHNLFGFFASVIRWADVRRPSREPLTDGNGKEISREEARMLALKAKADAKHARELERQRLRDERQAERDAKHAAKEQERAERQAAIERLRADELPLSEPVPLAPPPEPEPLPAPAPKPAPKLRTKPVAASAESAPEEADDKGPYVLPPVELLNPLKPSTADHGDIEEMSQKLVDTLKIYDVNATLAYTIQGPVVTKYALTPELGTRPEKFLGLLQTLKMALKAKSLRIEAPIPGEDKIGVEVPNKTPAGISFREIFESDAWKSSKAELPLLFGRRADGRELVADLATMPHMLVAGATGQGKSVCLNSLICGLLMSRTPEQLKLIMVDPKSVEFTPYSAIPHLLVPVITDNKKVVFSLHWAVAEMEKRLKMFSRARVRNIYDFNHRKTFTQTDMFGAETAASDMPKTVPYIVIIIDEAADLIGQCGKEVNPDIQRITQKARAAGIHVILATQRPDAKIITGTIKANIPGRVAFKTSQAIDSRTILDEAGAENLIGRGDMLFRGKDNNLIRAQGAWISDEEIAAITGFIEQHSNVQFDNNFAKNLGRVKEAAIEDPFAALDQDGGGDDQSAKKEAAAAERQKVKAEANASDFKKAVECIINTNRASTSHFQRKLGWGYNHSAKIMDMLEDAGIIGPQSGAGPRQIIMDQQQLLDIFNGGSGTGATASAPDSAPPPSAESADLFTETNA